MFLIGDLFNLFVFFEVMLVVFYGLMLYGLGLDWIKVGLYYIVINFVVLLFFLIGVVLVYGIIGMLNFVDIGCELVVLDDV